MITKFIKILLSHSFQYSLLSVEVGMHFICELVNFGQPVWKWKNIAIMLTDGSLNSIPREMSRKKKEKERRHLIRPCRCRSPWWQWSRACWGRSCTIIIIFIISGGCRVSPSCQTWGCCTPGSCPRWSSGRWTGCPRDPAAHSAVACCKGGKWKENKRLQNNEY